MSDLERERRGRPAADRPDDERSAAADTPRSSGKPPWFRRRAFLYGTTATVSAAALGKLAWNESEHFERSATVVLAVERYDGSQLEDQLRRGLAELGYGKARVAGKRVLLKPNLVEPRASAPHINTHPLFVRAVAEVFRRWDASEIVVAEGQGHCRDTHYVLEQSGLERVLREARLPFVDLNHDDVEPVANRLGFTSLQRLYLPRALRRAELVVSLPKMKTHHWAGVTLSMKNLFGTMPGIIYGWPKNVLHHQGIGRSILDITAAVRPGLAIVDGIVGMDGDGPIMGRAKRAGLVVIGENLPAVDATAARLMKLDPQRVDYLAAASGRLGPIQAEHIEQRGESIARHATRFELLDHPAVPDLRDS